MKNIIIDDGGGGCDNGSGGDKTMMFKVMMGDG